MKAYCKAYPLPTLRTFPQWAAAVDPDTDATLDADSYAFVCDDLTVVLDPINDAEVLLGTVTAEWRAFCGDVLEFAVPADLQAMLDAADAPTQ